MAPHARYTKIEIHFVYTLVDAQQWIATAPTNGALVLWNLKKTSGGKAGIFIFANP